MADTESPSLKVETEENIDEGTRNSVVRQSLNRVKEALQREPDAISDDFWGQEFQTLFMEGWEDRDDDLLYYVHANPGPGVRPFMTKRIGNPDCPPVNDRSIKWEESYYLNMVLHSFDYHLTITVDSQVMKRPTGVSTKVVTEVYASPSKIQMEQAKGGNMISYPDIFFTIHDFFELFDSVVCAKNERLCVEIVASLGNMRVAVFQGSVLFEKLLEVYQAKRGSAWTEFLPATMRSQNIQFLDMKGPRGKGRAQISIKKMKVKTSRPPTPNQQQSTNIFDNMFSSASQWWEDVTTPNRGGGNTPAESPARVGTTTTIKLNACLAFVSIHVNFIMADFLGNTYREPTLDRTYVKEKEDDGKGDGASSSGPSVV